MISEQTENKSVSKRLKPKPSTESLRIKRETKKKILSELAQLNKKEFGRPITPDQYVSLAISLLTKDHLESLREQSLSNKDRLEKRYTEFCARNGRISKDEFIGILLKSDMEALS